MDNSKIRVIIFPMKKLAKRGNMNARMSTVLNKFKTRITSYPPGMCPLVLYRSLLQMSMNLRLSKLSSEVVQLQQDRRGTERIFRSSGS